VPSATALWAMALTPIDESFSSIIFQRSASGSGVAVLGVASRDPYRRETVKAVIAPRRGICEARTSPWGRGRMAACKVPHIVGFVAELPKTASGKILWRQLHEDEK
jgi:acyl-coenzyme A synthetase/AMP-(fatty) acid ligase